MNTRAALRRAFYASPPNQRRILIVSVAVFLAGIAAVLFSFLGNTATSHDVPLSKEPAQVAGPRKQVPVDAAARRVAGEFILTAVAREDLARSYDLVHPELRQGLTRKQWATGNIPVIPYPAGEIDVAKFTVDTSYPDELFMQIALLPHDGSSVKPQIFFIGLKRIGGPNGPWKVSYWVPRSSPAVPQSG